MSTIRQEQHDLETAVYQANADPGVRAMLALLQADQTRINSEWIGMSGEALCQKQGEAKYVAKMIKIITRGPTIK